MPGCQEIRNKAQGLGLRQGGGLQEGLCTFVYAAWYTGQCFADFNVHMHHLGVLTSLGDSGAAKVQIHLLHQQTLPRT